MDFDYTFGYHLNDIERLLGLYIQENQIEPTALAWWRPIEEQDTVWVHLFDYFHNEQL